MTTPEKLQEIKDNSLPDSYYKTEEGECDHSWRFVGRNKHGDYYRCKRCGLEEEA